MPTFLHSLGHERTVDMVMAIWRRHRCSFYSGRQQGLASSMSRFFLSNVAFSAITSKLDKALQDEQERYTTRCRDKKRDMARRLIALAIIKALPQ